MTQDKNNDAIEIFVTTEMTIPAPFKGDKLMFCDVLGDPEIHFAWWPRKCWDGSWTWMRPVWARLYTLKPHLDGPRGPWWQYAKVRNRSK